MVLPMALRRWLPAVLLLAALGWAAAPVQMPQPVGGHHATVSSQLRAPESGTVDAVVDTAPKSHAALLLAESAGVDAVLAPTHTQSASCADEAWAATPPDVVYRAAEAVGLSAALSPPGDLPPSGALNCLDADPGRAAPVGLLLADLAVRRT